MGMKKLTVIISNLPTVSLLKGSASVGRLLLRNKYMKKIFTLLVLAGLFMSNSVFAVHNVYSEDGTKVTATISDELWNEAMLRAKVFSDKKLPLFRPGQTVTDEHGIVLTCEWFMFMGCQDPTRSEAYRTAMRNLAKELIAKGWDYAFPIYQGWVNSVK